VKLPYRSVTGKVPHVRDAIRRHAEDELLDRAAALFARHGFAKTSVQAVAESVGLSKAGLLHHFASKEALRDAVLARAHALQQEVLDRVSGTPLGPARDQLALEILVDQALGRPGLVAFALSAVTTSPGSPPFSAGADTTVLAAFGVDVERDEERLVRVIGALSALSMLALVLHGAGRTAAWRAHVLATCFDALGHHGS
jgi:AcrR family transcriptional regulator